MVKKPKVKEQKVIFTQDQLAEKEYVRKVFEKFSDFINKKKKLTPIVPKRAVDIFKIMLELYEGDVHLTKGITSKRLTTELVALIEKDENRRKNPTMRDYESKSYVSRLRKELEKFNLNLEIHNSNLYISEDKVNKTYFFIKPSVEKERERVLGPWEEIKRKCRLHNRGILEQLSFYNSKLYVKRKNSEKAFYCFLNSDKNILVILGESGKGKTYLLCRLSETIEYPCLYFSGDFYQHTQFHIRQELEILIRYLLNSESLNSSDPLSKVNYLASSIGSLFLIIIDGLNNFSERAAVWEEIVKLAMESKEKFPNLKFCISCRTESWNLLIKKENVSVPLSYMYIEEYENMPGIRNEVSGGVKIEEFEEDEIEVAIKKYQKAFSTKGELIHLAQEVCRDPFFLRMVFETYKNKYLPNDPLRIDVLDLYWKSKIEKGRNNKKEFIYGLVDYLRNKKSTRAILGELEREQWFANEALESLLEEGVVVISPKDRYEVTIGLFHDKFLEYALGRRLYHKKEEIFENVHKYLKESEDFEPLKGGVQFFLEMLEKQERQELLFLFSNYEEGRNITCEYISSQNQIDDNEFEIFKDCIIKNPIPNTFWLTKIGMLRPEACISLAREILEKYSENELVMNSVSYTILVICEKYPQFINIIQNWLQSPNPFIQGAAVTPMLGFLIKANENKAVDFFEKSILSENIYVRREIANFGIFNPPWNKKFISLIEKLCADQDERVRSICAGSLSNLAQIHTNLIEYFSKWSRSNDGKVRETTAIAAGKSYLPGSTHILKIIKKLSTDENDKVKILLIEALTQPRFLRGKYYDDPIKQDSQNIIPIIERIILEVDNKARKQIALCFSFRKFNNILTKWLKSQQWQLRQVALMSIDSGFIAPFIRRKLLRDSVPAVREALAFSLRFNDGREGLIEEHITLLDELFKDNNFDVKFATVSSALTYSSKKPEFAKNILGEFISQKPPLYYKILLGGVISIYFNESAEEEIDKFYLDLIISSQSEYFQVLIPSIMFVFPRKVSEKDCLKVLKKIFSASEWQTRALAIKYFGLAYSWIKDFKKPSISDSIVKKLCRDDNHTVRRELVESLSRIILVEPALKPKIWSLIYQLSKDKDWWVRVNVAMALGFPLIAGEGETILSKYSTEATNVLKELTNDNDWGVRISALLALTFLKGKWSKNLLEYFLKDKDSRVREWAKRIKGESITQKLIYEFYAEMLCRNLNQFKDEIEFIIISEHQIDVAESLIMPMLKFNIKRITALLKEWETNKDPFLREVSSHILEKIKRNMI